MHVNLYAPTTQYPGANSTVHVGGSPTAGQGAGIPAMCGPEQKLMNYASRVVAKPKCSRRQEQECLNSMEVTGMRHYKAVTQFVVQDDAFEEKVKSELAANECPEGIAAAITNNIMLVEKEMKVKCDSKVENGEGHLFKIAWCMERDGGRARVSFMVFGASFSAKAVEHFETTYTPIFKEEPVTRTRGWLWWKTSEQRMENRLVGTEKVQTPVFKTMTSSQVSACMEMLEIKAAEKVLETADIVPAMPAHTGDSLSPSVSSSLIVALLPSLLPLAAWGIHCWLFPKTAPKGSLPDIVSRLIQR